jgi:nitroreductase
MELSETLRRRRSVRRYAPDPVPEELLQQLVAAANRAPTASNVPYREILVVDDRRIIEAIRQISPAMLADPPALLVILTDLQMAAERIGRMGQVCSWVDSGAAGENVLLAAVDLGLGAGFTMISAMAGIRVLLGLPEHVRVDLMIPVGYPAPGPRGRGSGRPEFRVHRNQYER